MSELVVHPYDLVKECLLREAIAGGYGLEDPPILSEPVFAIKLNEWVVEDLVIEVPSCPIGSPDRWLIDLH
jgi:hypothetical protein